VTFLARKVSKAKWEEKGGVGLADGEISADAITGDLRTTENTLSFWKAEQADDTLWQQVTLAIAAGAERLDKIDIVWLEGATLIDSGITLEDTPGKTPVKDLISYHVDAKNLDLIRLGKVAGLVAHALRDQQQRFKRVPVRDVLALLVDAVRANRMQLSDLHHKVREEVQKKLGGEYK
jgi:hypothetical protein